MSCNSRRCCALDFIANLMLGMGCLFLAQAKPARSEGDSPRAVTPPAALSGPPAAQSSSPWFIILNSPQDLDELWRKMEHPDLVVTKGDQAAAVLPPTGSTGTQIVPYLVESVRVRGRVAGDFADLLVELTVVMRSPGSAWVPIRLDKERLRVRGKVRSNCPFG